MYIEYEVAQIFKRLLSKFDKSFRNAFVDGEYLYASNGHMALVYRINELEWYTRPEGWESTLVMTASAFADMKKCDKYASIDVAKVEDVNPYMWWTADQFFDRTINKEKVRAAVKAGKPASGFHFEWKTLAALGEPLDWACFEYPIFGDDELPGLLLVSKRMDMFAISTPFKQGDESDAEYIINRTIGE